MLSYPIQARGLSAPALGGMMVGDRWSKRSALILALGASAIFWMGVAEALNALL